MPTVNMRNVGVVESVFRLGRREAVYQNQFDFQACGVDAFDKYACRVACRNPRHIFRETCKIGGEFDEYAVFFPGPHPARTGFARRTARGVSPAMTPPPTDTSQ